MSLHLWSLDSSYPGAHSHPPLSRRVVLIEPASGSTLSAAGGFVGGTLPSAPTSLEVTATQSAPPPTETEIKHKLANQTFARKRCKEINGKYQSERMETCSFSLEWREKQDNGGGVTDRRPDRKAPKVPPGGARGRGQRSLLSWQHEDGWSG